MIIDFVMAQKIRFDDHVSQLMAQPEHYFYFDEMADVYTAEWLKAFPQGTHLSVSGLDDGAEEYCIQISYREQSLLIDYGEVLRVHHRDRFGQRHNLP